MCHVLNNMLWQSCNMKLSDFMPPRSPEGVLTGDAFPWRHLALAPDSGPDMLAMDHFLAYEVGLNIQTEFDPSHYLNNASKGALRQALLFAVLL